jgi:hypothetical protein
VAKQTSSIFLDELLVGKKSLKIPIEEGQTTQWPKETGQKDKQRSIKHTHKTKSQVTRTPLKTGGKLFWENVTFMTH